MDKFGKSQPVTRREDVRFLTGAGRYIDDIAPANALIGYVVRSEVAHASITQIDVEDARTMPGIVAIYTAQDMLDAGVDINIAASLVKNLDGTMGADPARPVMAVDRVRYVGEAYAFIVAETVNAARDAAEAIALSYDELPAKVDVGAGGETLHAEAADNRAFQWGMGDREATDAAFASAARTVSLEVDDNRVIVNSMETRGCYAEMDGDRLHFAFNGQGVWDAKASLSKAFGIDADQVRVTNPDVGGGFGMKAFMYPEHYMVAFAARTLRRPVRWMSERTEAMLSDNGGRDLVSLAELAFDADNRITAYRVTTRCNLGAYNSEFAQAIQTSLFSKVLAGVYDISTAWLEVEGFYTNTAPVDAYRGAGRPEAIYVLERVIDRAARELEMNPLDLRRQNFVPADAFPYKTVTGETYDVGDFHKVLGRAEQEAGVDGFESRKAQDAAQGRLRGLGLCYYIESILGDPSESAKVTFEEDGSVLIYVGTQSNGQGHETVYTQFLADQTGIPVDQIHVVQGDSDRIARGGGTGGSRSVTVQNTATLATVEKMLTGFSAFLADAEDLLVDDVTFDDERFRIEGSNLSPTVLEVVQMAREAGREDLLSFEARATLPARSFPNGCHIAETVTDIATRRDIGGSLHCGR